MLHYPNRLDNALFHGQLCVMPQAFGTSSSEYQTKVWIRYRQCDVGLEIQIANTFLGSVVPLLADETPPFLKRLGGQVSLSTLKITEDTGLYIAKILVPWLETVVKRSHERISA